MQGVSYRASARDEAQRLGLRGWVRNLPSGEVEATVEGDAPVVERFLTWCRRGPPEAEVESVSVTEQLLDRPLPNFEVRR